MLSHLEWCAERVQRAGDMVARVMATPCVMASDDAARLAFAEAMLAIAVDDFRRALDA